MSFLEHELIAVIYLLCWIAACVGAAFLVAGVVLVLRHLRASPSA